MGERLYIFDTTLRDGQQTAGVDFAVADKVLISDALDALGVDYVEGGYPGANPTDTTFFESYSGPKNAALTAFGMTKRACRSADNDPGFQQVLNSGATAVCLVAKSWDYHVDVALGITNDENLACIAESVEAICAIDKEAMIDCEHFFFVHFCKGTHIFFVAFFLGNFFLGFPTHSAIVFNCTANDRHKDDCPCQNNQEFFSV